MSSSSRTSLWAHLGSRPVLFKVWGLLASCRGLTWKTRPRAEPWRSLHSRAGVQLKHRRALDGEASWERLHANGFPSQSTEDMWEVVAVVCLEEWSLERSFTAILMAFCGSLWGMFGTRSDAQSLKVDNLTFWNTGGERVNKMQTKRLVEYWVFFFSKCKGKGGSKEMDEEFRRTIKKESRSAVALWRSGFVQREAWRKQGKEPASSLGLRSQLLSWKAGV